MNNQYKDNQINDRYKSFDKSYYKYNVYSNYFKKTIKYIINLIIILILSIIINLGIRSLFRLDNNNDNLGINRDSNILIRNYEIEDKKWIENNVYQSKITNSLKLFKRSLNFKNISKNILLIGPPGVGKTYYLNQIKKFSSWWAQVDLSTEIWVGSNLAKLKRLLEETKKISKKKHSDHRPIILVIDEVDKYMMKRDSNLKQATDTNNLLLLFDEIKAHNEIAFKNGWLKIIVAGTTNLSISNLDQAAVRKGRFGDIIIDIDYLKTKKELEELNKYLKNKVTEKLEKERNEKIYSENNFVFEIDFDEIDFDEIDFDEINNKNRKIIIIFNELIWEEIIKINLKLFDKYYNKFCFNDANSSIITAAEKTYINYINSNINSSNYEKEISILFEHNYYEEELENILINRNKRTIGDILSDLSPNKNE